MKKVVVTGAGGRLGGGIARRLKIEHHLVTGVDLRPAPSVDHVINLSKPEASRELSAVLKDADSIIHCAAVPGPSAEPPIGINAAKTLDSFIGLETASPSDILRDNLLSTTAVCEAATANSISRLVLSSSAFAMGWCHDPRGFRPKRLPLVSSDVATPLESYGLSKAVGDEIAQSYARTNDHLEVISLRFTNIVKRENFYGSFPWKYHPDLPFLMFAWCHEDDVIDAHIRALQISARQIFTQDKKYQHFLIAAPTTRFAESTVELIRHRFGSDLSIDTSKLTKNHSILDATDATNALQWQPRSWTGGSKAARAARNDPSLRRCNLAALCLDKLPSDAELTYRVYGHGPKLAVVPTSFGAVHTELEYHIGTTINPDEYTIVVFNMLGNGVGFSPSNKGSELEVYPQVITIAENVLCQKYALQQDEALNKIPLDLVYGYSMGAMQGFEWARTTPDLPHLVAVCGASGCRDYNRVFLEALIATLDQPALNDDAKLRAFAAIYAGYGVGYDFYAQEIWRKHGFKDLDDFLQNSYRAGFQDDDPRDLLAMVRTWRAAQPFSPDELRAISTRCLLLPATTDSYFRLEEIRDHEAAFLPNATLAPIDSPSGHRAGDPWRPGLNDEHSFLQEQVRSFLSY